MGAEVAGMSTAPESATGVEPASLKMLSDGLASSLQGQHNNQKSGCLSISWSSQVMVQSGTRSMRLRCKHTAWHMGMLTSG